MRLKSFFCFAVISATLFGCASTNEYTVFHNTPLFDQEKNTQKLSVIDNDPSLLWVTAISGGGTRAASFAYGVLEELRNEQYTWGTSKGARKQTLLSQTDFIRGVSGGSVIASYYALNGERLFRDFRKDFLEYDFQGQVLKRFFNPFLLANLNSKQYGRAHVLAQEFESLFFKKTFKDLRQKSYAHLTVIGTDLTDSSPFEFTATQFNLMCSNLDDVPISLAVAASSAVPLVFSPITFQNFSTYCTESKRLLAGYRSLPTYSEQQIVYKQNRLSYADEKKAYIHVVDGGLSDNLGVQGLINHLSIALGDTPLRSSHQIKDIVLLVINASQGKGKDLGASEILPSVQEVIHSMSNNSVGLQTRNTLYQLNQIKMDWSHYLQRLPVVLRSRLAPNVRFHLLVINLTDFALDNPDLRKKALAIPTTFSLSKEDVSLMIRAGHEVLRRSPDYIRLKRILKTQSDVYHE